MSYPRLIERFGKQYSWKMVLNPRCNLNERRHAVVGDCNTKARETYVKGWKRSLAKRVKPLRYQPPVSPVAGLGMRLTAEPGASTQDPKFYSLRQKVADSLSKVRSPQLTEFIQVGDIVGSGIEGTVRPGFNKVNLSESDRTFRALAEKFDDKVLAVKTVEKGGDSYGCSTAKDYREVKVMEKINRVPHPNIAAYLHTFESPIRLHIVTEYNQGGDLFAFLQKHDFQRQTEKDSARVMMQLFCAALHTQEKGYVHLDLKLENVMRKRDGKEIDEGGVCLIDFGHASKCPETNKVKKLSRPVGSPSYAAPEVVLDRKYSAKTDCWSLGVIMYILLQGYLPFPHLQQKRWREFSINDYGNFDKGLVENDPFYYTGDWEELSPEAKTLCQSLLQVDAKNRYSLQQAINHPWFANNGVRMIRDPNGLPVLEDTDCAASSGAEEKEFFSLF